jgi:Fe-S cluster assembly protein SufD
VPSLDSETLDRAVGAVAPWVAQRRREAFATFADLDMPSQKEEVWRYVDLEVDLDTVPMAEETFEAVVVDNEMRSAVGDAAGVAVVVDGHVSELETSGTKAQFTDLSSVAAEGPDWLEDVYGIGAATQVDKFSVAAMAFASDGVVLRVPQGVAEERPFYIEVQSSARGAVSFPRIILVAEEGAEASVVIQYSGDTGEAIVVPQLDMVVGTNSTLRVGVVQSLASTDRIFAQGRAKVGRDATFRLSEAGLGSDSARLHLTVDLEGRGSTADIVGAYFGEHTQTLDYRYFMHHIGTNTRSDMFLKGAVEDEALSVFTGMIRIDEGAQRTNAFQTNRNLILSDGASAQSVPNLEILADDVRCGHGSTVGPLDEDQRYYLMSRGLERDQADRLQLRGFFEEALDKFCVPEIVDPIRRRLNAKYVEAQAEGRV